MKRALHLAATSPCRQKHGCLIVKSNRLLSASTNTFRNHSQYVKAYNHCSFHAEVNAMRRLIPYGRSCRPSIKNATLFIARINNKGEARLSKPCNSCQSMIDSFNIRKIVWTDNLDREAGNWSMNF